MAKNRKKVVLLIVEGNSDEVLLNQRLRQLFKQHDIRFEVKHTDILFSFDKNRKPIKALIGDVVKQFLSKRKFRNDDLLAVLHIVDTDGCFISEDKVVIDDTQQNTTIYKENLISVPDEKQRQSIINRNTVKSKNIRSMNSIDGILGGTVTYRMYYFSRHLEHVIFNEPNPDKDTKLEKVEEFIDELTTPVEEFLKEQMPEWTSSDQNEQYVESWNKISQEVASLQRSTNVPLLFEFIQMKTSN
ncbi:hypothetical protein [Chengkuizengella axinellae]|uniref:DUF4276 family protein n=1 Tax=Chengkuizengella axinellae TaxID=3064388 RepID=A0ABT9J3J7_9BACL|nr:hypothetical protein [Chengkuizengella sp. 2205SS18-9]MDP5276191.1 hypothetical protein [Chengkuizengella sp. 2205SS18-9]